MLIYTFRYHHAKFQLLGFHFIPLAYIWGKMTGVLLFVPLSIKEDIYDLVLFLISGHLLENVLLITQTLANQGTPL